MNENRVGLTEALNGFQIAAHALNAAWDHCDGDAIGGYPSYLPSFDEFVLDVDRMEVRNMHTPAAAEAILRVDTALVDAASIAGLEYIGSGDALRINLDGEAWIWITEDMGGEAAWQPCLYLDSQHGGYYLSTPYPTNAAELRAHVAGLLAARDQAAAVYDALFGLENGTGVALVLKDGGVETGTLTRFDGTAGYSVGVQPRGDGPEVLYEVTDIRTVAVLG